MLTAWILSLMVALQPEAPWKSTYEATAAAIDKVVQEEEPLFPDSDPLAREKTAALLVSLAWYESNFKPDAVGGHGRVRGLYQIAGHGTLSDPLRATRVAIEMMRASFQLCGARPLEDRLAFYVGGGASCRGASPASLGKSRVRVAKALWLVRHMPPPAPLAVAAPSPW